MPQTKPRYRQLADQFRKEITTGKYKAGDALPTEMEICETHKVSIPKGEIRDKYPNVVGFVETSCANNIGIGELKRMIPSVGWNRRRSC